MDSTEDLWNFLAQRGGVTLDSAQHARLGQYLDLLLLANQRMNLTRIVDRQAAEILHIGDALTLLPHLPTGPHRLADLGSGGGVPGIVLAIARGDADVTLIESTRKKAEFLRGAAAELGLKNVTVLAERAEDVGRSALRQTFDVAVARAVATLVWLAEWMLPLVKTGGCALAMKGPRVSQELPGALSAIRMMGGGEAALLPAELPGRQGHLIVRIPKIRGTDRRYPRLASEAKNRPLNGR
jgi:16S rRNA (guanine527-N7)-methyltransferase